ncbi:MAG: hypothetical protein AAFN79_21360 [Pseudomonadota bacterium]
MKLVNAALAGALLMLAACVQPPAPQETLQTLRYEGAMVTFAPDAREAVSREVNEAEFGRQIADAVTASLADRQGSRPATIEINVVFYTLPKGAAAIVPFATKVPTLITEVTLKDADTGAVIGGKTSLAANYASPGGIFVGSGAVSEADEQARQVIGEYVAALRTLLTETQPQS